MIIMSKLFLSVRITKKFFEEEEIKAIEKEIEACQSKSEFIRKAIKSYLKQDKPSSSLPQPEVVKQKYLADKEITKIKELIKKNQLLLKELTENNFNPNYTQKTSEIYEGRSQEQKTEQVLNLLNDF
ncbi:hypothetical protein MWH28_04785 [Natroniella sulfidigena]|uniref:hypothetical protein n=1 Tax=Natroniella sulfidigena TaxID=723921 RepID=UPI00200B9AC9|nr:hypothetical protein [Natroniella sulfidigena]MCK8816687.1 hypothetical protein [Natroniella sulfidigena]